MLLKLAVNGVVATSLSLIVPMAVASPSVAFAGLDNVSVKVSSSSSTESSVVATLTVFEVSFAANVSVPDCCREVGPARPLCRSRSHTSTATLLAARLRKRHRELDRIALGRARIGHAHRRQTLVIVVDRACRRRVTERRVRRARQRQREGLVVLIDRVVRGRNAHGLRGLVCLRTSASRIPPCSRSPLAAVPSDVAYSTVTCWLLAADSDTVKATASPSAALASDTLAAGMITGPATTLDSECDSGRSSEGTNRVSGTAVGRLRQHDRNGALAVWVDRDVPCLVAPLLLALGLAHLAAGHHERSVAERHVADLDLFAERQPEREVLTLVRGRHVAETRRQRRRSRCSGSSRSPPRRLFRRPMHCSGSTSTSPPRRPPRRQ